MFKDTRRKYDLKSFCTANMFNLLSSKIVKQKQKGGDNRGGWGGDTFKLLVKTNNSCHVCRCTYY